MLPKLIFAILIIKCVNCSLSAEHNRNSSKLVFHVFQDDVRIVDLKRLNASAHGVRYQDADILVKVTEQDSYIGQIDYSLQANLLIWRSIQPHSAICAIPLDNG